MLVEAISINSFFSFWKRDYSSDMHSFKEPFIWHDFMFFLNPSGFSQSQILTSDMLIEY